MSLTDLESLYTLACSIEANKNEFNKGVDWATLTNSLRNLIDDRTALYTACVAVSALEGEANSKALTDAAIVASDLLITA